MNRRSFQALLLRIAVYGFISGLAAACGGPSADGGDGGSGSGGGIGGSGLVAASDVVIGEITGFGSVFVNNERFDTSKASIIVNGTESDESLLSIGMRVSARVDLAQGVAGSIDYLPVLIGPIEQTAQPSDRADSTFVVLGQLVRYNELTVFQGMSANELMPGFVVEVSGSRNADGEISATFIRAANNAEAYQLSGNVSSAGAGGSQLQIGGVQINIAGLDLGQLGSLGSLQGLDVTIFISPDSVVTGSTPVNGSAITSASAPTVAIGSQLKVTGLVKRFSLGTFIAVDRYSVVVDDDIDIRFANGDVATLADIVPDRRIEVTAIATGLNILVADKLVLF